MSREIKFRAWDTREGLFVGVRISDNGKISALEYDHLEEAWYYKEDNDNRYILEQYTGLKDEDGKEIYEGDIVTLNCYWEEVDPRDCFAITFEDGCFRVGDGFENEAGKYLKEYRLAGNIHENPELLGGEDA